MGCIIVMMPRQSDAIRIKDIIRLSNIPEEVVISKRGSETLEIVENRDVSVVICTRKSTDMGYEELSSYLPMNVMLLLLTQDAALMPSSRNVMKLMIPFRISDLINSLRMLLPAYDESKRKNRRPPARSPEEQKIIDDAKAVLIDRNGMTEPEAYRYIQKISMDKSRSMLDTAQMILSMNGG